MNVPLVTPVMGSARMNVAFVEEVDIPGIGAGRQRAVLGVGRGPAERDDVARPEYAPSVGEEMVTTGRLPTLMLRSASRASN